MVIMIMATEEEVYGPLEEDISMNKNQDHDGEIPNNAVRLQEIRNFDEGQRTNGTRQYQ